MGLCFFRKDKKTPYSEDFCSGFVGGSIEDKTFIMHVNQKILRVSSFIGPIVFNLKFFELDDFQPLGAKPILKRVNFF